jgi:dTMP kinase
LLANHLELDARVLVVAMELAMATLQDCAGKFITFEGIEGVGKSTQVSLISEELKRAEVPLVVTREPGGTEIAEAIRTVLLTHYKETMVPITELLMLFAARAQHINTVIKPALKAGSCVICDRFTDATYAYQGGGRGVYLQNILQLENMVQGDLRPDFTILLDTDNVNLCLTRAKGVGTGDRIEMEQVSFFERVRKLYLARANGNPSRFKVLDAMQPVAELQKAIISALNDKFTTS